MLYPLHAINLNVLMAQGRSDLFFRLEVIKKSLVTVAIALTWRWGITAMIYGQIVTSVVAYYINCYYTGKLLSYPVVEQLKDFIPILGLASLMGFGVFLVGYFPLKSDVVLLLSQVSIGIVLYASLCIFTKTFSFLDISSITQELYSSLRHRGDNS
jgi:O-antigen/teichoic acid export membrane protein